MSLLPENRLNHLEQSPRLFKTRLSLSNHQTPVPTWMFQLPGQFSIITVLELAFQSLLQDVLLTRSNSAQIKRFSGGSAAAGRTAAAWKICISLRDHALASETGEQPPEGVGTVILGFNSQI